MTERAEVAAGVADVDLSGRTALVTGATSGIGRETALALGRLGARVLVHGRDRAKGEAIIDALGRTDADGADLLLAEFDDPDTVGALADEVTAGHDELAVLVNNAGGYFGEGALTAARTERTFAVNHLAPFLLTLRLLPVLRAGAGGRVVTVSSEAHRSGEIPTTDDGEFDRGRLRSVEEYNGWEAYARSKLANVLFAVELAERVDPSVVTSNCCHPGTVLESGFTRNMAAPARGMTWLLRRLPAVISDRVVDSAAAAAATPTYLAAAPDAAGVTGEYFADCDPTEPDEVAADGDLRAALWEASVELTGVGESLVPSRN